MHVAAAVAGVALAVLTADATEWEPALLLALLGFSVASDLAGAAVPAQKVKISGSFLALVLAMALLGGAAAAAIGVVTMLVGWLRWREAPHYLLNNVVAYTWFPLAAGLGFHAAVDAAGIDRRDFSFAVLVVGAFGVALALNFLIVVGYAAYLERASLAAKARKLLFPVLPSELAAALLAALMTFLYARTGVSVIAFFALVLITFQTLLGKLLVSEQRAEELERRTTQLARFQLGLISALLHTLDARDRMTARHSAAVARYSREIARAAGLSDEQQEMVHTAGLLHDIGKFIFPDHILKGDKKLSDEDWETIKQHPEQGARIISQIDGYGPIAEIVHAHHERIDGKGYPRGLAGDDIPVLARIISIADTYDVMTARDSYRKPVSSFEAIQELRRVSGAQLDGRLVEAFVEMLGGKDLSYRHGEAADFDAELQLERRVHDYALGGAQAAI